MTRLSARCTLKRIRSARKLGTKGKLLGEDKAFRQMTQLYRANIVSPAENFEPCYRGGREQTEQQIDWRWLKAKTAWSENGITGFYHEVNRTRNWRWLYTKYKIQNFKTECGAKRFHNKISESLDKYLMNLWPFPNHYFPVVWDRGWSVRWLRNCLPSCASPLLWGMVALW